MSDNKPPPSSTPTVQMPWFRLFPSEWRSMIQGLHLSHVAILLHLILMMLEGERPVKADYKRLARLLYSKTATIETVVEQLLAEGKLTRIGDGLWSDIAEKEMQFRRQKSDNARRNVGKRIEKDQRKQRGDRSADHLSNVDADVEAEAGLQPADLPRSTIERSSDAWPTAASPTPRSHDGFNHDERPFAPIPDNYQVDARHDSEGQEVDDDDDFDSIPF